ncbi:hypothetical protein KQX54_018121 [Cotesia glomerata]|uniref:Uncharacterized protein n=1 Tax=Cotesia glomerata TaxID=32391 RepID=A0AAV7HVC6_COTGL|nr:hypothetical protein KQX54_018121 [Cotesia glomerata]
MIVLSETERTNSGERKSWGEIDQETMEKGSVTSFPIKIQRPWTQSVIGRDLLNWENITTEGKEKLLDSFKALGETLLKVTLYNGGRSKNGKKKKGKGLAPFAILSRSESEGEEKVISIEKHDPGVTFKNSGPETRDRSTL